MRCCNMVYKYQIEVLEEIEDAVSKLESMTEEHYRLQIGWRHTNNFDEENIPLFIEINGDYVFTQQTEYDCAYDSYSKCEICNYNRVELYSDIFLDLNKLIDRIITDNHKREEFYEKLNKELKALNNAL